MKDGLDAVRSKVQALTAKVRKLKAPVKMRKQLYCVFLSLSYILLGFVVYVKEALNYFAL